MYKCVFFSQLQTRTFHQTNPESNKLQNNYAVSGSWLVLRFVSLLKRMDLHVQCRGVSLPKFTVKFHWQHFPKSSKFTFSRKISAFALLPQLRVINHDRLWLPKLTLLTIHCQLQKIWVYTGRNNGPLYLFKLLVPLWFGKSPTCCIDSRLNINLTGQRSNSITTHPAIPAIIFYISKYQVPTKHFENIFLHFLRPRNIFKIVVLYHSQIYKYVAQYQ